MYIISMGLLKEIHVKKTISLLQSKDSDLTRFFYKVFTLYNV